MRKRIYFPNLVHSEQISFGVIVVIKRNHMAEHALPDRTELRITLNQQLVAKLDQLKALLSGRHPHLTDQELIAVIADIALTKLDPSQRGNGARKPRPLPAVEVAESHPTVEAVRSLPSTEAQRPNRHIPAAVKRAVWVRDNGRCTHQECPSNHKLQYNHIRPVAKGGVSTVENLRLLCQTRNLLAARLAFGDGVMARYLASG